MGKIALLVPRQDMLYMAHNILQEKKYNISEMHVIHTRESVPMAMELKERGISIIIARGLQAKLIKQNTDIPVIEIMVTAQEMGLLITQAKKILNKPQPRIAVIGAKNMFCDMSYFNSIYEIDMHMYYAEKAEELENTTHQAIRDGADLVMGGEVVLNTAEAYSVPSLFLSTKEDSIKNAFEMAESMNYAVMNEKKNQAQMETLLDYSYNGVIRLDKSGLITMVNESMKDMLDDESGERCIGRRLPDFFRDIDTEKVEEVLRDGQETYSTVLRLKNKPVFLVMAPVRIEDFIDGAIVSCHLIQRVHTPSEEKTGRNKEQKAVVRGDFSQLIQESKNMLQCIHLAKLYSQSEFPVLIKGETGTEKRLLAESIHNNSIRNSESFLTVNCGMTEEDYWERQVFGSKGILEKAEGATIYLEDFECMPSSAQSALAGFLERRSGEIYKNGRMDDTRFPVKFIASTSDLDLAALTRKGDFREDLSCYFSGLVLLIPPLRERPEDLKKKITESIRKSCKKYGRYHHLTQGGEAAMLQYSWPGNLLQVEVFCEYLILTASHRNLDEIHINQQLEHLFGCVSQERERNREEHGHGAVKLEYTDPRAGELIRVLRECCGNRKEAAEKLGISTSTLWRKMKKYGITRETLKIR